MQESICKHCGRKIYHDEEWEWEWAGRQGMWSSNKIWFEIWCSRVGEVRHEPSLELNIEKKKQLLAAKEIMHRDLMTEIEDLRREISREELKRWIDSGGIK